MVYKYNSALQIKPIQPLKEAKRTPEQINSRKSTEYSSSKIGLQYMQKHWILQYLRYVRIMNSINAFLYVLIYLFIL